mmetsp:Transcript_40443/g.86260  ORF Transcript_40443/g.86260 Transcript_40443/m.86260 type:complete len:232 (-) Transcript_40443:718-1413(-)
MHQQLRDVVAHGRIWWHPAQCLERRFPNDAHHILRLCDGAHAHPYLCNVRLPRPIWGGWTVRHQHEQRERIWGLRVQFDSVAHRCFKRALRREHISGVFVRVEGDARRRPRQAGLVHCRGPHGHKGGDLAQLCQLVRERAHVGHRQRFHKHASWWPMAHRPDLHVFTFSSKLQLSRSTFQVGACTDGDAPRHECPTRARWLQLQPLRDQREKWRAVLIAPFGHSRCMCMRT